MKPILIIEDEIRTAQNLQKGLSEHGYSAEIAHNGQIGLDALHKNDYELLILDVMLPEKDGWEILTWLKQHEKPTPVLMLTAQSDLANRVKGLQLGADDYLAKPFAFSELLARVEAILRRTRPLIPMDTMSVGDLRIQLATQMVFRSEKKLELAPKEFQLLCVLAESTGRFVSRKDLAQRVWQIDFDCETNVVDVAIRRLRQKVDEGFASPLIHTVRGVGYVLEDRS